MNHLHRSLTGLFFAALLSGAHAQAPTWQQPDYVEKAFIEIAFKREYKQGTFRLARWRQPIRYYIRFEKIAPSPQLTETIERHMRRLSHLSGHIIERAPGPLDANIQIILTQTRDYAHQIRQRVGDYDLANLLSQSSNCMANFRVNWSGEITDGWAIIPADQLENGVFHACVVEELTQIMGLPNDSDWVNPSIANDHSAQQDLSPLDELFLKLLYDPALKPGITLEQARPILRRLIKQHL